MAYIKLVSYADDTSVVSLGHDAGVITNNTQNHLNLLTKYFHCNLLKTNPLKTSVMSFFQCGTNNLLGDIYCGGDLIEKKSDVKFLGLILQDNLKWEKHIDYVCNKINRNSYILKRLSQYLPANLLLTIYYGVIYSHLNYGIEIWGSAAAKYMDRLLVIQKKVLRFIFNTNRRDSCIPLFKTHNILTVYALYSYKVITLVKNHTDLVETRCNNLFRVRVNKKLPNQILLLMV